jgi:uncharacterized protein involved in exopolysaccharide biosynthesis
MSELIPGDGPLLPVHATTPVRAPVTATADENGAGPEPIDLKESLGVLRRHLWLVLLITAAAVLFTAYRLHN